MRRWVVLLPMVMQLFNGCMEPLPLEVDVQLVDSEVKNDACFVAEATGRCHLVTLEVWNRNETYSASVAYWSGHDDQGAPHIPLVHPSNKHLAPGERGEVLLGFELDAPRFIVNVTYEGTPAVVVLVPRP